MQTETNKTEEQITRTVSLKIYQADGCWWARLDEKLNPPTYPCGAPRLSGNNVMFSSSTADGAKQKAIDFIRGAAEALRGGSA